MSAEEIAQRLGLDLTSVYRNRNLETLERHGLTRHVHHRLRRGRGARPRQLLDLRHGEYVDSDPGRWLTWHGRGVYGPHRYACGDHRGELKACVREHYGTLGWHPWAVGPHPWAGRRGTDRARRLARSMRSTFDAPGS